MRPLLFTVLSLALTGAISPLRSAQYAILVGVGRYPAFAGAHDLDGPRYDVAALKDILVRRYGFAPANIESLLDEAATKAGILGALRRRIVAARSGDRILFYFAGHGTSAFDQGSWLISSMIGPNSGALLPYDLRVNSAEAISESMIIGRRDLRPILTRLNPEARAWVVLDSCYSENAVRSLGADWEGATRAINVVSILNPQAPRDQTRRPTPLSAPPGPAVAVPLTSTEPVEPYPYSNVVSFSAASRDQPAREIDWKTLRAGRSQTFDGQPHGVFTQGLLRALNGLADTNHDGDVTYDELFRSTREIVQGESKQRPQVLPRSGDALHELVLSEAGTERPQSAIAPAQQVEPAPIKVALDGIDEKVRRQISALANVEISQGSFDLLVRQGNGVLELRDRSRATIREYSASEVPLMLKRISGQPDVERVVNYRYPPQNFNLTVDVDPVAANDHPKPDFRAEFTLGESVAITVSTEKPAYLLVLDVDTAGVISVLYPAPNDAEPFTRADSFEIARAKVRRPTGSEFVKAFAFLQEPPGFEGFMCRATSNGLTCPELEPGNEQYQSLLKLLGSGATGRAEAHTRILTREP